MDLIVTSLIIIVVIGLAFVIISRNAGHATNEYPYRKLDVLFSPAERSFFGVLSQAASKDALILGKVRVADVITPKKGVSRSNWQKAFNKISNKHFDFILCDKNDLSILCAIELNDCSHNNKKRKDRDAFLEGACQSANVPLIQIKAQSAYNINEIKKSLALYLPGNTTSDLVREPVSLGKVIKHQQPDSGEEKPCPNCLSILVKKTAKRGENAGNEFWACSAFPKCRYTEEIT